MRIIHKGRGQVVIAEDRQFIDTTVQTPRGPGRRIDMTRFKSIPRRRDYQPIEKPASDYKPGTFLEIADDGCRFTLHDNLMCGAKANPGTAWCECHRQRVYEQRGKQ